MPRLISVFVSALLTLSQFWFEIAPSCASELMPCSTLSDMERDIPLTGSIARYNECVKAELNSLTGDYNCRIEKLVGIEQEGASYSAGEREISEPNFKLKIEEVERNSAELCSVTAFDPANWPRCFNNFRLRSSHSLIRSAESPTPFQFDSALGNFRLFLDGRFTASMSGLFLKGVYSAVGWCAKAK